MIETTKHVGSEAPQGDTEGPVPHKEVDIGTPKEASSNNTEVTPQTGTQP